MKKGALSLVAAASLLMLWSCTSSSTSGSASACSGDAECSEDEVCEDGQCVEAGGSSGNGSTTSSGLPETPKQVCEGYLECLTSASPSGVADALAAYGPTGTCWLGDEQVAEACAAACRAEMKSWHDEAPEACPACVTDEDCGAGTCEAGTCKGVPLGFPGQEATCNTCRDEAVEVTCAEQSLACAANADCFDYATCVAHCAAGDIPCESACFPPNPADVFGYWDAYTLCICTACMAECSVCT